MESSAGKPLAGKVCIVTGASRGIGKGIALQLGENGAIVYITGKNSFYIPFPVSELTRNISLT